MPPIDAFQHHRQLGSTQQYRAAGRLRPDKSSSVESLREQTKPISVMPDEFDQIAAAAAEHKHVTGEGMLFHPRLYQSAQPGQTTSQIGDARSSPNPLT